MRKCKFLGYKDGIIYLLKKNKIYNYEISKIDTSFPYHIYFDITHSPIATYSKPYFDALFIDINIDRKQKLQKLQKLNYEI